MPDSRRPSRPLSTRERDYVVPIEDKKGHSIRMQCRVPTGWPRQVDIIIGMKRHGWKTPSDFMRWALLDGMQRIEAEDGPIEGSILPQLEAVVEICRTVEYHERYEAVLDQLSRAVSVLMAKPEGKLRARQLIQDAITQFEQIGDAYFRGLLLDQVKQRFSGIVIKKGKVVLASSRFLDDAGER